MSDITLTPQTQAATTTPASGEVVIFPDSADGIFKQKSSAGVVSILGDSGAVSAHVALSDPHTQYYNSARGLAAFAPISASTKISNAWKDAIVDGGCDNTGAIDCTAQIQALQNAMTSGGTIFFPNGTYRIAGTVTLSNSVTIIGQHRQTAVLAASSATGDMFSATAPAVQFFNIRFSTIGSNAALRTSGFAVSLGAASSNSGVRSCDILFQWSGIQSSGSLQFMDDLNIREYGANAINGQCILINGTGDRYICRLTTDNGSNPTGFAGVRVTQCASLVLSDSNIIHAGTCLALEPGNGLTVPSIEAVNCFFDTSVKGMAITPTGTGSVFRCKFSTCWFGTHTVSGVEMNGTQWDGITFENCDFYGSPFGINTPTGGGKWTVSDSRFAACSTAAINLVASAAHFPIIIGNTIAPQSAFGANTLGIGVGAGAYKGLIVDQNAVVNNTTNLTLGAVTVGAGEAGFFRISDNAGINPRGSVATPAVPASTAVVTNTTGFKVTAYMKGGTITQVTVNSVATALAASVPVTLDPGATIAVTFSVAFTWVWVAS